MKNITTTVLTIGLLVSTIMLDAQTAEEKGLEIAKTAETKDNHEE